MPWTLSADLELYAAHVWGLLAAAPAENTGALTVIEDLRAGRRWSDEPPLFGWYAAEAGGSGTSGAARPTDPPEVSGAVSMTPPYELLLAAVPPHAMGELVTELRRSGAAVTGVSGERSTVEAFVSAWTVPAAARVTSRMRMQLYRLARLTPPAPAPAGRARAAGPDDAGVAVEMITAFNLEAGFSNSDVERVVRDRIANGLVWLWEDTEGAVASMASRNRTAARAARIGPVYTPPAQRRHGYGTAVTAACTNDALERGADEVVLFTDLSNPTSNSIYQQIGFVPVHEMGLVRFGAPRQAT